MIIESGRQNKWREDTGTFEERVGCQILNAKFYLHLPDCRSASCYERKNLAAVLAQSEASFDLSEFVRGIRRSFFPNVPTYSSKHFELSNFPQIHPQVSAGTFSLWNIINELQSSNATTFLNKIHVLYSVNAEFLTTRENIMLIYYVTLLCTTMQIYSLQNCNQSNLENYFWC